MKCCDGCLAGAFSFSCFCTAPRSMLDEAVLACSVLCRLVGGGEKVEVVVEGGARDRRARMGMAAGGSRWLACPAARANSMQYAIYTIRTQNPTPATVRKY